MQVEILDTKTLPEALFEMIQVEKVRVLKFNGEIRITPITYSDLDCPLLGIATDCGFTVDEFLSKKREEKVLEGE